MDNAQEDRQRQANTRTAAEAGWRVSRYLLQAKIPGSENVAIYNTYRRSCGEYMPLDLYVMDTLDEMPENNAFIPRLAKGGLIVKFDEREALEAKRRLDCSTPQGEPYRSPFAPPWPAILSARTALRASGGARCRPKCKTMSCR